MLQKKWDLENRTRVIKLRDHSNQSSPFFSLVIFVKKADGIWRFFVDYKALNQVTIKNKFLIPVVEELLDELNGSQIFF